MFPSLRSSYSLLLLIALALTFGGFVTTSVSAQVQTGTPPFGSFDGGPDVINLANLNSHISIPVIHKPGRGTNFTYDLSYDSSAWYSAAVNGVITWQPVANWGWRGQTEILVGYVTYKQHFHRCPILGDGSYVIYDTYVYHDVFGIAHAYVGSAELDCNGIFTSFTETAADGSGYTINPTDVGAATITSSSGAVSTPPVNVLIGAATATDRNGNKITTDGSGNFYDTLSSTTAVLVVSGTGTPASPMTFTYTAPSGSAHYTVHYTSYLVQTAFGCSGIAEYGGNGTTSANLVSEIDLPDGSKYTFAYESTLGVSGHVTGRLASVILPTGGTITYGYSGGSSGHITCADGSAATLTRTTPDGQWTYAQVKGTGAASTTTVTDPTTFANQTAIQFQGIYETQRAIYQGSTSGTLLQTINTCYNAAASPCTATAVALPIAQRTTSATVPGPGNLSSLRTDKFDAFGNVIESDEYDLGIGSHPLLRQTLITYASLGHYLNAFNQTVTVKDGSGNIKSRQDTSYDQYSSFTGANCITGVANHDDTGHGCSFTARANATSTTSYTDPVTPSGGITKNFTFDSLGNLRTAQSNCCQLETLAYSTTTAYAYPDSVTKGSSSPQLTTAATYDLHMGLVLTSTDPNSIKTTLTYDNMGRPLTVTTGSLPATNYSYTDSGNWTVKVCSPVQSTQTACRETILDGLGRTKTSELLDGNSILYSATDTQYDSFGRAYKTSNPYTGSPSYWTQAAFDVLGRTTSTTLPDNSVSSISYADNTFTTTDPANKKREAISDGLGRLKTVYEPDPTNGDSLTLQTSYAYNVFDQLTQVTQGSQTRTFVFDALGRLNSSTTLEAGTVCFGTLSGSTCQSNGYDSWNNLQYRTDARGVVTNYLYDSLNRLIGVTYPTVPTGVSPMPNVCAASGSTNNANVCYTYGTSAASYNNGRVTAMTDPSGSESYTYDAYGNVLQRSKIIGTTAYTTSYQFNYANLLSQITYPSGRAIAQNLDTLGRLSSIVGTLNSIQTTYASGFSYNAAQQTSALKYGNNLYASFGFYSDTLLLQCLDYSTTNRSSCAHDSTTKFGLSYSFPASPANNGQIAGITDAVDTGRSATYAYDSLYRLTTVTTTGSTAYPKWGVSEVYDRFGNRSDQNQTFGSPPMNHVIIDATHNRISGAPYAYDLSGNMTNDGVNTLAYDGENRATSATNGSASGTYSYDGKGLRIKKVSGSTTTVYIFSGSKVIAEYDNGAAPAAPSREYTYSGTALLAKIDSSGTRYYHKDHLSNRLVTDSSGNTSTQLGHFPFGESWYNSTNDKLLFTSYERDSESGNDYAMARSYVNRIGRFASPDPLSGDLHDPQSLNRYAYVGNDPCNRADPLGLSSTCTFNLRLTGNLLSDSQKTEVANMMNSLLSSTQTPDGNTVQISTNFSGNADYSINLGNGAPPYQSNNLLGQSSKDGTFIFVNNISRALDTADLFFGNPLPLTWAVGGISLHEFAHEVGGRQVPILGDLNFDAKNPNLMMFDKAGGTNAGLALTNPNDALWKLSPEQVAAMYRDCILHRPSAPKPPTNRGGGGTVTPPDIGGGSGGVFWLWVPESSVTAGGVTTTDPGHWQPILY